MPRVRRRQGSTQRFRSKFPGRTRIRKKRWRRSEKREQHRKAWKTKQMEERKTESRRARLFLYFVCPIDLSGAHAPSGSKRPWRQPGPESKHRFQSWCAEAIAWNSHETIWNNTSTKNLGGICDSPRILRATESATLEPNTVPPMPLNTQDEDSTSPDLVDK